MTLPNFAWMLTECGDITALPPGTSGADVLPTGPVYELTLCAQPSVKIMYTHKLSSNVNAKASSLAGHAVNGDACLIFRPTPSAFMSPAVLLNRLLGGSTSIRSTSTTTTASTSSAAATATTTSSAAAATSSGGPHYEKYHHQQQQQQYHHQQQRQQLFPLHRHCSQHRHRAMQAILQSRNATPSTTTTTTTAITAATATTTTATTASDITSDPHRPAMPALGGYTSAGATAAAGAAAGGTPRWFRRPGSAEEGDAGQEPPYKSARSSGEFHSQELLLFSRRGDDPWVAASAEPSASSSCVAVPKCEQATGSRLVKGGSGQRQPRRQLEWQRSAREKGVQAAAPEGMPRITWMELDDDPDVDADGRGDVERGGGGGSGSGGNEASATALAATAVTAPEAVPVVELGGVDMARNKKETLEGWVSEPGPESSHVPCAHVPNLASRTITSTSTTSTSTTSTSPTAGSITVEADWEGLTADAVVCIAMQLRQHASQVQTMAAVCKAWRAALLAHTPLLRRIAFSLPGVARPPSQDLTHGSALSSSAVAAVAAAAAPLTPLAAASPPLRGVPALLDERAALAAAMSRQYVAGAFLLPSHGSCPRQQQQQQQELAGMADGIHSPGQEAHIRMAVVAAEAVAAQLCGSASQLRVLSLPRLLLAAAQASNPSAQLILAQLLEAYGDPRGALRWWRKLATQAEDVMAMFKLGMASYDGSHGLQPDSEAAHFWLGRTVRTILGVDNLSAISMDGHQGGVCAAAPAAAPAAPLSASPSPAARKGANRGRVSPALKAMVSALDPPQLHMLGWSSIVLGYLEFDSVASRAVWGMGNRSEAVRFFRLAEGCGLAEASAVLGWLYNTGQY